MSRAQSAKEAVAAWVRSSASDAQRADALLVLIDGLINASIVARRQASEGEREALAAEMMPLRAALAHWPFAAELPTLGALLGCLQDMLRGNTPQRQALDAELGQQFAQIERLAQASDDELRREAIERNYEQAEQAVLVALEQGSPQQREALAAQLAEGAREAAAGEGLGSPWRELAQFMQASAALLRRLPVDERALSTANRRRVEHLLAVAQPDPLLSSGEDELPPAVLFALMQNDPQALDAALAALPEAERDWVVATIERQMHDQMTELSEEERLALAAEAQNAQIAAAAERAQQLATLALRSGSLADREDLAAQVSIAGHQAAAGEPVGSPWHDLAAFLDAVAALLRGQPVPAVLPIYQEQLAAVAAGSASPT